MPQPDLPALASIALHVARAKAIEQYSALEQSLCRVFGRALGTEPDYAGIVFFKITSARGRLAMIEKLLRKRLGDRYASLFWNPAISAIKVLDQKRNEIVHWTTLVHIGDTLPIVHLVPPNLYDLRPGRSPYWDADKLNEFKGECDYYSRLLNMYWMNVLTTDAPEDLRRPWLDRFQQAQPYPPPDTHPLSPNYKEP